MLLNLSNHPSSQWSEAQIKMATELYGEIQDMEFPAIDPGGDEEYISNLANDYLKQILEIKKQYSSLTVHLMGELTFCFTLVQLLCKNDIPCVASTTRRMVEMKNNTKVAVFDFVRFRNYVILKDN